MAKKILKSTGLDLSDRSIELVEIEKKGKGFKVNGAIKVPIPMGVMKKGEILNQPAFDKHFNDLLDRAENEGFIFENVTLTLPEEFIEHIVVELTEEEAKEDIEKKVLEKVKDELNEKGKDWQYEIIEFETGQGKKYLYTGIPQEVLYNFVKTIEEFGIDVRIAEPDSAALLRSVDRSEKGEMMIDFGAHKILLYLSFNGMVYKKKIINWGSEKIIDELSKASKISKEREEKFFERIGHGTRSSKKQKEILGKFFDKINKEVEKFANESKREIGLSPEKVYYTGGLANMVGISELLSEKYNFEHLRSATKVGENKYEFITSVGSAHRLLNPEIFGGDINFLSEKLDLKIKEEIEAEFQKKEEELIEQVLSKGGNDPEKKELKNMFNQKWGYGVEEKSKWGISFKFTFLSQILFLLILGAGLLFGIFYFTFDKRQEQQRKENELTSQASKRDYFTYNFEMVVSTGENLAEVENKTAMFGRFDEYTVELSEPFVPTGGVVDAEDIFDAKRALEEKVRSGFDYTEFLELKSSEVLIPEAVGYIESFSASDAKEGVSVPEFNYTLKAKVKFAIVEEASLRVILEQRLIPNLKSSEIKEEFNLNAVDFLLLEDLNDLGIVRLNVTVEAKR